MTSPSRPPLEITLTLFLAITAQSLLLIPNRQVLWTADLPAAVVLVAGIAAWLLSRWQQTALLANDQKPTRRYVHYFVGAAVVFFSLLYIRAGFLIQSVILLGLTAALLAGDVVKQKGSPLCDKIAIALLNLAIGTSLIAVPRLFLQTAYEPLLNWQTELGVVFFLTGLYALPIILRNRLPISLLTRSLLALPWLGYTLADLFAAHIPGAIPAFALVFYLLLADQIPWERIVCEGFDRPLRFLLQAIHGAETLFLSLLTGLLYLTPPSGYSLGSREVAFIFFLIVTSVSSAGALTSSLTLRSLALWVSTNAEPSPPAQNNAIRLVSNNQIFGSLLQPFFTYRANLSSRLSLLEQQFEHLQEQRAADKRRVNQMLILQELSRQLEPQLDHPVAAQLTVNALERALNCALAVVLSYEAERRQFGIMAIAGPGKTTIPPSYHQNAQTGVLGRTVRLRKTQIVQDTRSDPDYICLQEQYFLTEVSVPLIHHGHLKGALIVDSEKPSAFSKADVEMIEAAAAELLRAWERSNYQQRLTSLIQAGVSLSTLFKPQTAIETIAQVTRQTLEARFVFVTLSDQEGKIDRIAHAGSAPTLLSSLAGNNGHSAFAQAAINARQPFRIRDVRKSKHAAALKLDDGNLRSVLIAPIRLHSLNIGAILAFGKQGELFFSENDETLAGLLSSQAAAAVESAWLYQELRNALGTATLLYQLSSSVLQAEKIEQAAQIVAETAFRLAKAGRVGIVLFTPENNVQAQLTIDKDGIHTSARHPRALIEQVCKSGQSIFVSPDQVSTKMCYPLKTPLRNYGALWLEIPESQWVTSRYVSNLQALANQAAVALERSILLAESRQQAKALENAYGEMENTYDRTLAALTSALDARDRETKGHSLRVAKIASNLGKALGLPEAQIKALERGALLHDIGKIGISDTILHKPGPLSEPEWQIMRMHPEIGARIVEGIPFLEESLPVIRYHQERWDGSGYPIGLQKNDIPLLARIFAVADAFDALTSTRPYRRKVSVEKALAYLKSQSGILFDPKIVEAFEGLIKEGAILDLLVEKP